MISLDEARAQVLASVAPLPPARLDLADLLGRVTAEAVTAAEAVPPFDNTAVDGFAVRAADVASVPCDLDVVATVAAGAAADTPVGPGQAVRIMTGAPLPAGADAIVMVEDTSVTRAGGVERVSIGRAVGAGDAVRRAGSDVTRGQEVIPVGTELGPAHLGVLASINRRQVLVHPPVRVGVLSTGDELVEDGGPLQPGQIRESNRVVLRALLERTGVAVIDLGLVRDDEAILEAVLRDAALRCDAIVTSGGVSMGDYDVVKAVLDRIAEMTWMQIAIKPAKPFAFGLLDDGSGADPARRVPVFGLPGNPVSSMVSFELLARPALRKMAGHAGYDRITLSAVADESLRRGPDGKIHLVRVHGGVGPDGRWHVRSTGAQGSHQLAASAAANGLAVVPDGDGIPAGGDVTVMLLIP